MDICAHTHTSCPSTNWTLGSISVSCSQNDPTHSDHRSLHRLLDVLATLWLLLPLYLARHSFLLSIKEKYHPIGGEADNMVTTDNSDVCVGIILHTYLYMHTLWTQLNQSSFNQQMSKSYTLRISCRQIGLQYFRGCQESPKSMGQAVRKGWGEPAAMAETTVHRWTFFFTREASALILRHFSWSNQAQPDYLRKLLLLKLIMGFNHIYGKTVRATPRLVFYLITGDHSLENSGIKKSSHSLHAWTRITVQWLCREEDG